MDSIDQYLQGKKLYGDDFKEPEIRKWYMEEEEGYSNLINDIKTDYSYQYHTMNNYYGFRHTKHIETFENVLGIGSAFGDEFLPIINKIRNLTIIEPSENLRTKQIGTISPKYVKPNIHGSINYENHTFDLITCFGTLHHVPNVNYVLSEAIRVLKPNGLLLLREPVRSMGDWRFPRKGLTRNERGIPHTYLDHFFKTNQIQVIRKSFCESLFAYKILKKMFNVNYNSKLYPIIDGVFSKAFQWNVHYHPTTVFQKIGPGSIFYVARKPQ